MAFTEAAVKKGGKHGRVAKKGGPHRRSGASSRKERIADMQEKKVATTPRKKTPQASPNLTETKWHVIDADGQVLGRLASEVAQLLRGKHKPTFSPNVNVGDGVIIVNAAKVKFTGNKLSQKKVRSHSGYPGGLKEESLLAAHQKNPAATIERAVRGMLPRTKLGREQFRNLRVYVGPDHRHTAQDPTVYVLKFGSHSKIHPSTSQACDAIDQRDPVFDVPSTEGSSRVTKYDVKHKSSEGSSLETDDGDFLATFRSASSTSYVWHTPLNARDAMRACFEISDKAERLGSFGEEGPVIGYFSDEMHVQLGLSYGEFLDLIDKWIPESGVKLTRLETHLDTFIWEAASPLQSGLDVPSLAIISESLTPQFLDQIWTGTVGTEDPDLRKELGRIKASLMV
jgi:large subunit ribosomal protein L13